MFELCAQIRALFTKALWGAAVPGADAHNSAAGSEGDGAAQQWPSEVLDIVQQCLLVVGLHPDEATEEIIQ